ncbi:MAG TPA: phosphate ABC transporter substrate-binding protein PstS [Pseudonocardia sp.]
MKILQRAPRSRAVRSRVVRGASLGLAATVLLGGCGAADEPGGGAPASATALRGAISGAGASSQQAAMQAWATWFTAANPEASVEYDAVGSGAGRTRFLAGTVAFAGSDAVLTADELAAAEDRCRGPVVEVPAYVSPIAVVYNLPGVEDLRLSPATLAGVFEGRITEWDDPAIAAENPGVRLPDQAIVPVHRSDDSGTTQNFTDYLKKASGGAWSADPAGAWPGTGGQGAQGTSGVVAAVGSTAGAIGYADESQAGGLATALVRVGDRYTGPTPAAASAVLGVSRRLEGRGDSSFAFDLARDTAAADAYPIVLVSYLVACGAYPDEGQAKLVKGLLTYAVSADGQRVAAQAAGSAPLPDGLRTQVAAAVDAIRGGA